MKTLSVKLSERLEARLAAIAQRRKMTKSAVVRAAIEDLVGGKGKPKAGSALDLAKDLAGCVAGPADLSVNKYYLKNFGR